MKVAIPNAASKVRACKSVNMLDRFLIAQSIENIRYDYEPNLGLCGWTFPLSWYIEIGKTAFNTNDCCDLASTIAHEASHVNFNTEGGARGLECRCFGCSC